jgi:hypothetical protein
MEPTSTSERATGEVVAQGRNFMMKDEKDHNILSIRISLLQSQLRNEKHSNSALKRENSKLTVDIAHHLTVTARAGKICILNERLQAKQSELKTQNARHLRTQKPYPSCATI